MNLAGKSIQEWEHWLAEQYAKPESEREAPENVLNAFRDLLELVYEKVPEQKALELVKPTPKDATGPQYKGKEGTAQTADIFVTEVTEPKTDSEGIVTFKVTGARAKPEGPLRSYEFVGKGVPKWYGKVLVVGAHVDVVYKRYGPDRRIDVVAPCKITEYQTSPMAKAGVNPDIEETKAKVSKPAKKKSGPSADDSDNMWG